MSEALSDTVLAIDLGGTKIAVGVIDSSGKIIARAVAPTPRGDPRAVLQKARELAATIGPAVESVKALGIALPGILDTEGQILVNSPSSSWTNIPFTSLFADDFRLPAIAGNDANLCAIAEHVFGAGKELGNFFWMTVSTGIGGACFIDGTPLRGRNGMAGEIGHLVVRPNGRVCSCGNRGCLEAEAAGPAWAAKARDIDPNWQADALVVSEGARARDRRCLLIVDDIAEALAQGIASVLNLMDPEAIFIGGGVSGACDLLIPRIMAKLPGLVISGTMRDIRIEKSALGCDAALMGAAALALKIVRGVENGLY